MNQIDAALGHLLRHNGSWQAHRGMGGSVTLRPEEDIAQLSIHFTCALVHFGHVGFGIRLPFLPGVAHIFSVWPTCPWVATLLCVRAPCNTIELDEKFNATLADIEQYLKEGWRMIAAIYARLNTKAVDRALQAQADRLCSLVQAPVVLPTLTQELTATR